MAEGEWEVDRTLLQLLHIGQKILNCNKFIKCAMEHAVMSHPQSPMQLRQNGAPPHTPLNVPWIGRYFVGKCAINCKCLWIAGCEHGQHRVGVAAGEGQTGCTAVGRQLFRCKFCDAPTSRSWSWSCRDGTGAARKTCPLHACQALKVLCRLFFAPA